MKILVCVKQVCESDSPIRIDDDARWVQTDNITEYKMNRLDEFAVEEALRIKKQHGGKVTILSVGADKAVEAIRTGLAMGADAGILVDDPAAPEWNLKMFFAPVIANPFK